MCVLRQIFHEAIGGVAVVLAEQFCIRPFPGRHMWERRVNLQSRRALLKQFAPQYREASYCPKTCAVGCLCPGYGLSSTLWDVAAQPCRGRVTRTSLQAFKPLRARSPTCAVPGLERSQPHLRQTAHALSSYA